MKKTGNYFLFLCVLFVSVFSWAADVKVEASVDRNQMGIGDSVNLTVTVQSDDDFEMDTPKLTSVPGLELINSQPGGRQSSSNMTIINGKTQFVHRTMQEFIFTLSPQKEGSFVIPPVEVAVNGQTFRTNAVKIDVKEEFRNGAGGNGGTGAKGRPRFPPGYGNQGKSPFDDDEDPFGGNPLGQDAEDMFDQLLKQQQKLFGRGAGIGQWPQGSGGSQQIPSRQLNINTNEAFFVYLDVDKTEVYEGEQITANWYIYTRASIDSLDRVKFPDLKGFWKEIIEEVPSLQFTEEMVNGVLYRKALLASHALFPIKAGTAVIDEFKVKAKVRLPTQFGPGRPTEYQRASRRTEIKVLPLPKEGKTLSFSGAVGNYRVSLKTDGNTFPANQPFSIRVRYEGIGNAKLIDLPHINWPEGLEVYDTKSDSKFFKEGNSFKEFEILVIPRREGEMKIPALELTYFDPQQKKYVSEATTELTLQIGPGSSQPAIGPSQSGKGKAEAAFVPQPILQWPEKGISFSGSSRLYLFIFILAGGVLALLIWFFIQLRSLKTEPVLQTEVNKKLALIEQFSGANDLRKVGSEATNLIYLLVANLAGQKKADQEIHILINEISSKDKQLFLERITQLFDYFQLLGFSPVEIMQAAIAKKPVKVQVEQLQILAKEIVAKFRKEQI